MNEPSPAPPPSPGPVRDQLSDHEYDGIREYDNPTPSWWVWVFVATVIFAALYFVFYHAGAPNRTVLDRLADASAEDAKKTLAALGIKQLTVTEPNMLQWMGNKVFTDYGMSVYKANCATCHGTDGQGLVGPNLTDDYFKNIKKLTDIPRVVANGANNGNMPAQERLGSVNVALVSTYVASLRGKNLPSGSTPAILGDKIDPWPPIPATAKSQPATQK